MTLRAMQMVAHSMVFLQRSARAGLFIGEVNGLITMP
jgi:hypothetical protein